MSYGDEYYCPNCNAILNDQYGFDPDKGTWTCTACGQRLMDDDIYKGDTFEGVEWRCDRCNALLNRQYGFSDSLGSWTCTECGHTNGITEDDIIDESDIIRCPNCDGVLNNQFGFSEYDNDFECSFCGVKLHRDYTCDDFSVVEEEEECLECPKCGANLKNQWSYNDWSNDHTCADCGAALHREYSSDDFEIVEKNEEDEDSLECPNCYAKLKAQDDYDPDEEDWTCTECGARLHHDYSDDEYEVVEEDERSSSDYTSSHSHSGGGYSDYGRSKATHSESKSEVQKFYCPNCGSLLNKQYEFNHKADEHTCKVCHTLLYHYYTDEPYEVKHTRERASHTSFTYTPHKESASTASHRSSASPDSSSHRSSSKSSKSNDWLLFFLCLFLGYLGVHKFAEGKVGMGILYIFTTGLFYVGWFVDIVKYFKRAIN